MAFITLLRALDVIVGASDLVRQVRGTKRPAEDLAASRASAGQIETRLAGAAVAAIKEAFDRDSARLDLERARMAEDDRRAAVALRLDSLRRTGERLLAECRMQVFVALAGWIVSVVVAITTRGELSPLSKGFTGAGWLLLLAALAASFAASARVLTWFGEFPQVDGPPRMAQGSPVRWLLLFGLALTATGILLGL